MSTRLRMLTNLSWLVLFSIGCGGDDPSAPEPPRPTVLEVLVQSSQDSVAIGNSNVVLYDAASREAIMRSMTDPSGLATFRTEMGDYYLTVAAQDYRSVPPRNITPVPFYVAAEDTTVRRVLLDGLEGTQDTGYIVGSVTPALDNFLVLAESQIDGEKSSTVTGPDGVFVLYNLPYADYALEALKSGYEMNGAVNATLTSLAEVDTVEVGVQPYDGSLLTGAVTFLASENSFVEITLLDPETRSVIPGLKAKTDSNLTYRLGSIPDGDYLAWASLANDRYVIDPDWVFKNPDGLDVAFSSSDTTRLSFSVTDAIPLLSPTNPAESTLPAMADSVVPTFRWQPYPSTKEYFIEVRNLRGDRLWGGFESDGTVNHAFIGGTTTSVEYNFDDQPDVPDLVPGEIYQWRLWADKGTQTQSFVEQLISSSEDLRGLFRVPTPTTE